MAAREGLRPLISSAWGSDVFGVRGISRGRSRRALEGSQLAFADSEHLARATREFAGNVHVEVVRWGIDREGHTRQETAPPPARRGDHRRGPLVASVRGLDPLYNPVSCSKPSDESTTAAQPEAPAQEEPEEAGHGRAPRIEQLGLRGAVT